MGASSVDPGSVIGGGPGVVVDTRSANESIDDIFQE